jgi:hypothetical protein
VCLLLKKSLEYFTNATSSQANSPIHTTVSQGSYSLLEFTESIGLYIHACPLSPTSCFPSSNQSQDLRFPLPLASPPTLIALQSILLQAPVSSSKSLFDGIRPQRVFKMCRYVTNDFTCVGCDQIIASAQSLKVHTMQARTELPRTNNPTRKALHQRHLLR